ncbi:hypothetical protein ACJ41P_24575 [Azospirillum argentinense]|uniref:Uncharacterized protein n=1 Tax=Azospirillum argentinense TaxID=2970906 RepID=A0ABW8VFR7_9PROT
MTTTETVKGATAKDRDSFCQKIHADEASINLDADVRTDCSSPQTWAWVPEVDPQDGWYPTERGYAEDGLCRLDARFHGRGSWAVRRLGGKDLADRLVAAVEDRHAADKDFQSGAMVAAGILFDYWFSPNREHAERTVICNAELVAPDAGHSDELKNFFLEVWKRRARHALAIAERIRFGSSEMLG